MKRDIENKEDIEFLIESFYKLAMTDETIGYIFTDIVQMKLEEHLPVINRFWDSVLFGTATYRGNPMLKHIELNKKVGLTNEHFDRWVELWSTTINENFEGEKAEEAKNKAKMMKELMQFKIKQSSNSGFIQ